MTAPITYAALSVALLREQLLATYPGLAEDDQALADTIEGETDFNALVVALIDSAEDDKAMALAIGSRIADLQARQSRIDARVEKKRSVVAAAMEAAGVRKIEEAAFTISLRNNPGKLIVTDEAAIPTEYWREKITRSIDKKSLADALAAGSVPGADLSNGSVSLTIRTK